MKKYLVLAALTAFAVAPALAGTDVGVSVGIDTSGMHERVGLGDGPHPAVLYSQPVIVAQDRYSAQRQPVPIVREQWVQQRQEDHDHWHDERRDWNGRGWNDRGWNGRGWNGRDEHWHDRRDDRRYQWQGTLQRD